MDKQLTLTEYNGYDISQVINEAIIRDGFAVTVNGERVNGSASVAQNGTLYFSTPARTTRGFRTVYVKLGQLVRVSF